MERTIKVTGKGKVSIKPDRIRLKLHIENTAPEYESTLKLSAELTEVLKDLVENLGFARTDLKTLYFNVDTEYSSYQDEDKNWQRRFEGYKFTHRMKLEFDADNKLLGRVLYELAHCAVKPEFSIEYTVRDSESAKNELLARAVQDSMDKAKVLTDAAGVSLGNIISIDYSWAEIDFVSRPMNKMMLEECCMAAPDEGARNYDIDIEADDIDVTDTVTIVWQIV